MSNQPAQLSVLHLISALDPRCGGPVAVVVGLAKAQAAAGMTVAVAATWNNSNFQKHQPVVDSLVRQGVVTHMIGPARRPMSRFPALGRILGPLVGNADIVHIHAMWEAIQHRGARICQRLNKPYLITPHGMLAVWSLEQKAWKKRLYLALRARRNLNRAAAIHYTTSAEQEEASPLHLKAPPLVETLGIDAEEFTPLPPRGSFRAKWPVLGERPMVLFLSRIHYKKGLDLLVPAMARAQLPPETMLVIAGPDDGFQATVQRMIDAVGWRDRVVFTGMLTGRNRIEAMVDADLFVLPSRQENFGIVVIEALASGCPVIVSEHVNIHQQIVRDGVGQVIPASVEALIPALQRWMGDADLRRAAGVRAVASVIPGQTWGAIAQRWWDHYRGLLVPPAGAGAEALAPP